MRRPTTFRLRRSAHVWVLACCYALFALSATVCAVAAMSPGAGEGGGVLAIFARAGREALGGGLPGMAASFIQVLLLMWLRTTTIYQYRHGGSMCDSMGALWRAGGVPRFYSGLGPALLSAPIARFADTSANAFVLSALESWSAPVSVKTAAASCMAGVARVLFLPIDTWKAALQVHGGTHGLQVLRGRLAREGPLALYEGSGAAVVAAAAAHLPWSASSLS